MCFSFEISIGTFLVSWTISLYLLNKNLTMKQKHNVIFLMIFSSIQLADAILWYIKMEKNIINYYVTSYIIPIILSLQIIYNIYVRNKINTASSAKDTSSVAKTGKDLASDVATEVLGDAAEETATTVTIDVAEDLSEEAAKKAAEEAAKKVAQEAAEGVAEETAKKAAPKKENAKKAPAAKKETSK